MCILKHRCPIPPAVGSIYQLGAIPIRRHNGTYHCASTTEKRGVDDDESLDLEFERERERERERNLRIQQETKHQLTHTATTTRLN